MKRVGSGEPHAGDVKAPKVKKDFYVNPSEAENLCAWCEDAGNDFILSVEIPMPADEKAWKAIQRNLLRSPFTRVQRSAGTNFLRNSVRPCPRRSILKSNPGSNRPYVNASGASFLLKG